MFPTETIFPPVYKGLTSAHLSNASNLLHQPTSTPYVQGQMQPSQEFYEHWWFRRLVFLIYGLTLALAGQMLYAFPNDSASDLLEQDSWYLALLYAPWLGYDLGIVWVFTISSLLLLHVEPTLQSAGIISPFTRIQRRVGTLVRRPWIIPVAGNFLIITLLASSAGLGYFLTNKYISS